MTPGSRNGPPCAASCGWPMDARDYEAGARYHPTCEPPENAKNDTISDDGEGDD